MNELRHEASETIADIIDHLLPLNYAPGVIQRLYDQQPARFAVSTDGNPDVRGQTALDYYDGPEVGPGMLPAVCNFLEDLVALQDTLWGMPYRQRSRDTARVQGDAELQRMIAGYVTRLQGALMGASKIYRGHTVYCVLKLPPEGTPARDFCKQVITEGRKYVLDKAPELERQLIFVELLQTPTDRREYEVETYIKARVRRTQHMRKL